MKTVVPRTETSLDLSKLAHQIKQWGLDAGFAAVGIADVDVGEAEGRLFQWLADGFHGEMHYMARHGTRRTRPSVLVPGTVRVISVRMNYLPQAAPPDWIEKSWEAIDTPSAGVVSKYAHGRDYHKVLRSRLQTLSDRIEEEIGEFGNRAFTDSAPVMEVELARRAALGWRGKHTLLLTRDGGSMFFIGEIFVDLPLPADPPVAEHCGTCSKCIDVCPTKAIVAPYVLDARRCISYLTIELDGAIPVEFRRSIGNRIYGCDDCQLACPWNKFAIRSCTADFDSRGLEGAKLLDLFAWSETEFLARMEGSAIRRIGHERWMRNIAVGLGNALRSVATTAPLANDIRTALRARMIDASAMLAEHIQWALDQTTYP